MKPGHLPERLPGHPHRLRVPVRAAQGAVRAGRAAGPGRGVRRVPHRHHPGHRPTRSAARSSTSRCVAFGQTSVLMAATLGSTASASSTSSAPSSRSCAATCAPTASTALVGPIRPGGRRVHRRDGRVRRPGPAARGVHGRCPRGDRRGRHGHRAGRGPAQRLPRRPGVSRVDDVPVLDSLGTLLQVAEMRARAVPRDRAASRRATASTTSSRRAPWSTRARAFYGVTDCARRLARTDAGQEEHVREDIEVDVVVAGAGACGVMTALRASREPRPRRRGAREEPRRGLQRRDLQRQPGRGRDAVPGARPASRTPRSGTPTTSSPPAATSDTATSSRLCARSRPTYVALDRRRPRLPDGGRDRHGAQGHVGATPARRPAPARRRAAHEPPASGCSPTGRTSRCSTRHRSPGCGSRTATVVGRDEPGRAATDVAVSARTTVLATDGFAANRALMQRVLRRARRPLPRRRQHGDR